LRAQRAAPADQRRRRDGRRRPLSLRDGEAPGPLGRTAVRCGQQQPALDRRRRRRRGGEGGRRAPRRAGRLLAADRRRRRLAHGPHPVVSPAIEQTLAHHGKPGATVASLRRDAPELLTLRGALGALYAAGHRVDWSAIYPEAPNVPLPSYPWQRERYWLERS